jgi:hypothetical protein
MLSLKPDPLFTATVQITVPGKEAVPVVFTFKHRTRKQVIDMLSPKSKESKLADSQYVLELATGWSLEDEFNAENLDLLFQDFHFAARNIRDTYFETLAGIRLGN